MFSVQDFLRFPPKSLKSYQLSSGSIMFIILFIDL